MTHDLRDSKQKQDDLRGVQQTTFNKKIGLYSSPQTIVSSVPRGEATAPSLHHCINMKLIFNIYLDPEDRNKTKIIVYCDE